MRYAALWMFLVACGKSHSEGLPPATDWSNDDVTGGAKVETPRGAPSDDPHAGIQGAPPIGETDEPEQDEEQPAQQEEEPPQHAPPAPADPATLIKGSLKLSPKLASHVATGSIIYLMAKTPGPDGKPTGSALAVERLVWSGDGQTFELSGAKGDVIVIARYDQDGEATKDQPGDIVGMKRVKIPADKVVIELDTLVP